MYVCAPQSTRAALRKEAKGSLFDVVVHDGAPNVGGAWSSTLYTQVSAACSLRMQRCSPTRQGVGKVERRVFAIPKRQLGALMVPR